MAKSIYLIHAPLKDVGYTHKGRHHVIQAYTSEAGSNWRWPLPGGGMVRSATQARAFVTRYGGEPCDEGCRVCARARAACESIS